MTNNSRKSSSGLAIASLVLGIIAIVLSFIPIINNFAFIIAIIAIILGIIPLLRKISKGKALAGIILGVLAIVITLAMQAMIGSALDEASNEIDKATGNNTEEVMQEDVNVVIQGFTGTVDEYGLPQTKLAVTVENKSSEMKSFTIHIEAVDSNGNRIADDYVYANNLNAGQSQDFETFTFVDSEKVELLNSATFNVIEASSF